jgi:hypothetical protein
MKIAHLICVVPALFLAACGGKNNQQQVGSAAPAPSITVNPSVPSDIPGGAPNASLNAAALFAWQEFISLNWPALGNPRDTADTSKLFGQPGYTGPLVWQTFRGKVEIFPGQGNPPGYTSNGGPYYGYDNPPQYVYGPTAGPGGVVSACPGVTPPAQPAWINLDEVNEIGLNTMHAGVASPTPPPGQQILFMAKANKTEYAYVAAQQWFGAVPPPFSQTATYVTTNKSSPPPGSTNLVSFNNGTIEAKAAWRRLTPAESSSGRFQMNTVRYYEMNGTAPCYREEQWGLLALHIIHKTPTAPYFVYATFGQADNMLDQNGQPIEDADGRLLRNQNAAPFNPAIASNNATSANPATPSSIQSLSPPTANCQPGSRIYYVNTPNTPTPQGTVCIDKRAHDIPQGVIDVNAAAHASIASYNKSNSIPSSPWLYYKLVNVQFKPINKQPGINYTGPDAATFYQANIVVETDYNLQFFSGRFQPQLTTSPKTNVRDLITDFNLDGTPFFNAYYNGTAFNMGGCMGCHANPQSLFGSDFSFILIGQRVPAPEPVGPAGVAAAQRRFDRIFGH